LNLRRDQETVKQFIFFEESSTDVQIKAESDVLDQQVNSFFQDLFFLGDFQSFFEELGEEIEGELIHGVDDAQIADDEIEDGASFSDGSVFLTGAIDFLTGDLGLGHSFIDTF